MLIVATRVVVQHMGEEYVTRSRSSSAWLTPIHHHSGYHRAAEDFIATARKIVHRIGIWVPEFYIFDNLPVSVVAFGAREGSGLNVLKFSSTTSKKGWYFAALRKLAAFHISVTVRAFPPSMTNLFLIVFSVSPFHRP